MSSIHLVENGDCIDDIPVEQLLPPDYVDCGEAIFPQIPSECCDVGEVFGEPEVLPRIGDEYQAELRPLIGEAKDNTCYSEVGHHSLQDFSIGLPLPLTWISFLKHEGPESLSDPRHPDRKNVIETVAFCNGDIKLSHDPVKPEEESQNLPAEEKMMKCSGEGHLLVPGLLEESWSDAEKASFLLALYIFEKNFVEVRRFIETKDMGAILSFFYGNFYGSEEYCRWSEGRKTKSKKCVYGQRIFSGLRQQELLSRLLPRVSEECKGALLEVSKTFGDNKMSLVDYVSSLKAMVGMNILLQVVGVGTGKEDLTGMALEPVRSNPAIARPEIPAGKACSSLTVTEIIKFLSGDYRLSKARSNDLFWEAVWPRLLARGWHSELPQDQGFIAGSKHFLVFLMPGVKKFSRRKLVKGDHYFDSITDVLSKVAKEPGLIELENEEADGSKEKEEHEWSNERKSEEDENDLPTRQRHFYLQPRTPIRSMNAIKFTIVDTSLSGGKVRELRSLPSQISNALIPCDRPEDSDKSDTIDAISVDVSVTDTLTTKFRAKMLPGIKTRDDNSSCQDIHMVYPDVSKSSVPSKNKKDLNDNKKPRKVSKSLLSRKQKEGSVHNIAPIGKRRRKLTANGNEETRGRVIDSSTTPILENGMSCFPSGFQESNEKLSTQVSSCQEMLSFTSSSIGSPCERIERLPISDIQATEPAPENPQTQLLIDLNFPEVSPEFESDVLATNSRNEPDSQSIKLDVQSLPNSKLVNARTEQQSIVNPRRLSTRYRPPTTRALEAVASGYLTVSRRRKGRDYNSNDAQPSRPSQRPRDGIVPNESSNSPVAFQIEEAENGASSSGTSNMPHKFHDPPESKEDSASRQ